MTLLDIGPFRFEPSLPSAGWQRVDISSDNQDSYMDEDEATKLVAIILEVFPKIREQINESKP